MGILGSGFYLNVQTLDVRCSDSTSVWLSPHYTPARVLQWQRQGGRLGQGAVACLTMCLPPSL